MNTQQNQAKKKQQKIKEETKIMRINYKRK